MVQLGVIIGRATGIKQKDVRRVLPTGEERVETIEAIVGMFKGLRARPLANTADTEIVAIRSAVLYLPGGISEMVTETLRADENACVEFVFRLSTRKAANLAGYEYVVEQLYKPADAADPLDRLEMALGAPGDQKRLTKEAA